MMEIEKLWEKLLADSKSDKITDNEYILLLVNPKTAFKFFAGAYSNQNVLIALEVNSRPPNIDLETQALNYFRSQRKNGTWLMVLRLNNSELTPVFGKLCQDLIDAALTMPSEAALIKLFKDRLNLWKKLFQNSNSGLLEKHEIKGLIGELLALEYLLETSQTSMLSTVTAWNGPQRGDQDFLFDDRAIEIKAISPSSTKVGISSIEQLDSVLPIELWIYILRESAQDEPDNISLNNQVLKIEKILSTDTKALNLFKNKILAARYVEHEFYENCCFKPLDIQRHQVIDDFPRLTRKPLPLGIEEASYSISLASINKYRI